jgi:hypothetical protein
MTYAVTVENGTHQKRSFVRFWGKVRFSVAPFERNSVLQTFYRLSSIIEDAEVKFRKASFYVLA